MRNLKRALSLTLASVMLLGMMVVGAGAAGYPDVDEDKHDIEAIEVLQAVKVMQGNDKGEFDPDSKVNRSQMAVVMANLLNLDYNYYEASCPFWDVPDWAKPYVAACYANGIVSGYNATTYGAADSVTAVQAASMMMRALGYFKYQEDYDQNGGFELATVKQANAIGLFDGLGANATAALTRNQVAKLAPNALEANMVNFTGTPGTQIDLGDGKQVNVGYKSEYTERTGTEKKYAALSALGDTTNVIGSGAQGRYYVQLGEELYNGKLTKNSSYDEFDRPTTTWKYDYKVIGDYLKTPDVFYTKDVALKDIYKDLGLANTLVADKVDFYDNGKAEDDDIKDNSDPKVKLATLGLGKNIGNKIGAKGVLTQVWYNKEKEEATITQVDTYVGKVSTIGNATADDRYVTLTGHTFPADAGLNNRFETPDFAAKDLVIYTAAWNHDSNQYDIQTMEALELSATGLLTRWEGTRNDLYAPADDKGWAGSNFTAGGTKYEYSVNSRIVDENGGKIAIESFDVNKSDVNVYLDKYGYAIYVSGVEGTKNYAALIGFGSTNQYGAETRGATLLMPDGTQQTVTAKLPKNENWPTAVGNGYVSDGSGANFANLVDDGVADVVTYSVGDDGVYTLTVVGKTGAAAPFTYTGNYSTVNAGKLDFQNGRSVIKLNGSDWYYTTSETIFMVATRKNAADGTKGYNYDVYTGYANAPSLITDKGANGYAFALDSFYTNQINVIYIDATNTAGISDVDTYFVKKKDATVYTDSDGKYFELPAIVDDEVTTVRIDADTSANWDGIAGDESLVSVNGKAYLFGIKNVTKNSKGIITGCQVAAFTVNGSGTVNTRADVLGVGPVGGVPAGSTLEAIATYWSYKSDVKAYWIDKDYKTISVIDIKDIGTDSNDKVYGMHDNGSPVKKLTDVIVVAQDDKGDTVKYVVGACAGLEFAAGKAKAVPADLEWRSSLSGDYTVAADTTVYVRATDPKNMPSVAAGNDEGFVDGYRVFSFKMPSYNVAANNFAAVSCNYQINNVTLALNGSNIEATASINKALDDATGITYEYIVRERAANGAESIVTTVSAGTDIANGAVTDTSIDTGKTIQVTLRAIVDNNVVAEKTSEWYTL